MFNTNGPTPLSPIPCLPLRPTDDIHYERANHPQLGSGSPERATRTCLGSIGDSPGLFARAFESSSPLPAP